MGSLVSTNLNQSKQLKQSKQSKNIKNPMIDKDEAFIGKNQHSAREAIYAAYPNHEVRFISMDPGEFYTPLNRCPNRINVIYNSETLLITEVRHE
jgi:hypothetical protein